MEALLADVIRQMHLHPGFSHKCISRLQSDTQALDRMGQECFLGKFIGVLGM